MIFAVTIPLDEPVMVFAVVLLVILLGPLLFTRLKIPGIVGLILAGVLIGPHGLNIIERDSSIILFGRIGLLYILFLAGLEIDLHDFKKNKNKGLTFGILTFLLPFTLGFLTSYYLLHYSINASILLASMFSTHTPIAYPIISKLGITQNRAVTVTIGGTIITDALVLIILAVITNVVSYELNALIFIKLFASLGFLVFAILWGVPRLARYFFKNLETEAYSHYIFVLSVVFVSGSLAHLIGVEPIIGAFLAGLALNQLIPNTSTLMNRIDFVGNSLFIPFFLVSVGMLVDVGVLFKGPESLIIALIIIVIAFIGKWLAAFITQKVFRFTRTERNLIWGMSSAHAAATIAVVLIGFNLKILDENILNATVLLILISCIGSSFISEKAGRKIAAEEANNFTSRQKERILVPIANLQNVDRIADLTMLIKDQLSTEPIYPLYVVKDDGTIDEKMAEYQKKMELALKNSALETDKEPVFRIDVNVAEGVLRAVKELQITEIIMGWNGEISSGQRFGPVCDRVIANTTTQLLICRLIQPLHTIARVVVVVPKFAEQESGFPEWVATILQLVRNAGTTLRLYCTPETFRKFNYYNTTKEKAIDADYIPFQNWDNFLTLLSDLEENDLFMVVMARQNTLSYLKNMERVPRDLSRNFRHISSMVLFPQQIPEQVNLTSNRIKNQKNKGRYSI
ncbi:cation:proton antiporter [Chryseosolibacter indicus]|uniref:Cation:proton antiporter n=1 Tax=Chryseosolibacter indicus TaxID=2782351 RepID=A0ABS5VN55_9BACT|nr:cation:proton antiporter [Chryseosolibacter indicus]MBT1702880.1 cation:proton antiporter [Chryseosolibacter indicus]